MHRDELRKEVRVFADNLESQILTIFERLGVDDYAGFRSKAEAGKVGRHDILDVAALLANVKYATDHNQIPKPQ